MPLGGRRQAQLLLLLQASTLDSMAMNMRAWEPHFLEDYPLAICNDGSPAAYYYRPGRPGTRRWLVFLEGGMWCWDAASCRKGVRGLPTSAPFPRTVNAIRRWADKMQGLFDAEKSPLAENTNFAYVRACSNDAFLGDVSPKENKTPGVRLHFRGKRIMEGVFTDLRRRFGMGDEDSDLVVYGGCSSGARGALSTIDHVVAAKLAGRARVVGLFDSALWVPISTYGPTVEAFETQTRKAMDLYISPDLIDKRCARQYPGEQRWKCCFPAYMLPFVRTPYFISHSQYDKFAINWNLHRGFWLPENKLNQSVRIYAERYRQQVVSFIPPDPGAVGSVVYSSACYYHCTTTFNFVFWVRVNGRTLTEALERWLEEPHAHAGRMLDHCDGFNCGSPKGFEELAPAVLHL
mmetsp:Transcript_107808/g.300555  ORF Transcript_107808/g.300555 Transcript_107808/m.300555 type:complete len:405 (+) Transcript_107808:188-1402(+)